MNCLILFQIKISIQFISLASLKIIFLVLALTIPLAVATAGCLNHRGEIVDWFVVYTTNANTKYAFPEYGYLYIDSSFTKPGFSHYSGYGNEEDAPIGLTLAQAKDQNLSVLAWNDQLREDQGISDRYKAHSKFYMAATDDKSRGFAMDHSVPNYPSYESEHSLIADINNSQRQKAQHHFCFTIYDAQTTKNLYDYGCFINPNIYAKKGFNTCKHWRTSEVLKRQQFKIGQYTLKAIFKNGHPDPARPSNSPYSYEGEIFELGILPMLQSSIVIQTFGSPRPKEPLGGGTYQIANSNIISVAKYIQWSQWFDHSKWVYAIDNDWVCFGDLNRNSYAQTVRGGAFYCIESAPLKGSLKFITPYIEKYYKSQKSQ